MKRYWVGARLAGKLFLVAGFILAIHGFSSNSPFWINVSLALLAAGILMMGVAFYLGLCLMGERKPPPSSGG